MPKNEMLRARITTEKKTALVRLAKSFGKTETEVLSELVDKFLEDHSGHSNTLVRVYMTVDYIVPDYVPEGNGQTHEQIMEEWFGTYANRSHATKDHCEVGGSKKVLRWEIVGRI